MREDSIEYEDTIDDSSPYCKPEITRKEKKNALVVLDPDHFLKSALGFYDLSMKRLIILNEVS